jgi:hypothetical protein
VSKRDDPDPSIHLSSEDLIPDRALRLAEDKDLLGHRAIAGRVAELVTSVDPPVNVALFGPWGSGKTSFGALLDQQLKECDGRAKFIHYDAWRFKGEPLQRNFISHAATALGRERGTDAGRPYHEGLYESIRSGHVDLGSIGFPQWLAIAEVFVAILALAALGLAIAVGIVAKAFGGDPLDAISKILPGLLPATVVGSVLAAIGKQVVDNLRIDVSQSPPTQEQLRDRFRLLIKETTGGLSGYSRVVFYVDELDRCPQAQIVETLQAIVSLFDEPKCVFVVAADRDALISALDVLKQGQPSDSEAPYRSTATEFFDKVFQFQLSLPPLRGPALSSYAADLVSAEGGVWAELRDHGLLEDVIYVLIPSHVRSPRRIKVLLNNFAANARIASSRGLDWQAHALQIAKLTALQTEYPLFTAHLQAEPRLLRVLLNPAEKPEDRSSLQHLAELYALDLDPTSDAANVAPIGQQVEATKRPEVRTALHGQFRQYLIRVQDSPDPSRDVLFLQPASDTSGLANADLSAQIEDTAIDAPALVVEAVSKEEPAERIKAIKFIAQMVPNAFGRERTNLVNALLGIAATLRYEVGLARYETLNAIEQLEKRPGLAADQLVPALIFGLRNQSSVLVARLFEKTELLDDVARTTAVALVADELTDGQRTRVWERVGALISDLPLSQPLSQLSEDRALEMLNAIDEPLTAHLATLDEADQTEFLVPLLDAVFDRPGPSNDLAYGIDELAMVSGLPGAYSAVRNHPKLVETLEPAELQMLAIQGIGQSDPLDWPYWVAYVGSSRLAIETSYVLDVLDVLDDVLLQATVSATAGVFRSTVEALVPIAANAAEPWPAGQIAKRAQPALLPWPSVVVAVRQEVLLGFLALRGLGGSAGGEAEQVVVDDLVAGLASPTPTPACDTVRMLAQDLAVGSVEQIADAATAVAILPTTQAAPATLNAFTLVQIDLARVAREKGLRFDQARLPTIATVIGLIRSTPAVLQIWLEGLPPFGQVSAIAEQLIASPVAPQEAAFEAWAAIAPLNERTDLIVANLDKQNSQWLLRSVQGDESTVVSALAQRIQATDDRNRREQLGEMLARIEPKTKDREEVVVSLIEWTLRLKPKADLVSATKLLAALPDDEHGQDRRLAELFRPRASEEISLTNGELSLAQRRGISLNRHVRFKRFRNR